MRGKTGKAVKAAKPGSMKMLDYFVKKEKSRN